MPNFGKNFIMGSMTVITAMFVVAFIVNTYTYSKVIYIRTSLLSVKNLQTLVIIGSLCI